MPALFYLDGSIYFAGVEKAHRRHHRYDFCPLFYHIQADKNDAYDLYANTSHRQNGLNGSIDLLIDRKFILRNSLCKTHFTFVSDYVNGKLYRDQKRPILVILLKKENPAVRRGFHKLRGFIYRATTWAACRPFGPCSIVNSTRWPSSSE